MRVPNITISDVAINRIGVVVETMTDFVCLAGFVGLVALLAGIKSGAI